MLNYALLFLAIALFAGALGFGGIAGSAAVVAKILLAVFIVLFVSTWVMGSRRPRASGL